MKMLNRLLFAGAALLFQPLVLQSAYAQQMDQVKIATLAPGALLWVHDIADAKGFYKAQRLDVLKIQVSDSPALVQAVASNSAQVGVSLGDIVMKAIDQNAPVIIAGGYLVKSSLRLVGGKDIKEIKQFTGTTMTAGAVKGGTTNIMLYQLKLKGVDPKTIQLVSIPNSRDRVLAMQNGQVRGAVMTPPFDIIASKQGLPILDVFADPYLQTPMIFNTTWAKQNRDVAIRMARASRDAAKWLTDPANRKEAVAILAKNSSVPGDVADASYQFLVAEQKAYSPDMTVPVASITNIVMIDRSINPEDNPKEEPKINIGKYYDASFLLGK